MGDKEVLLNEISVILVGTANILVSVSDTQSSYLSLQENDFSAR